MDFFMAPWPLDHIANLKLCQCVSLFSYFKISLLCYFIPPKLLLISLLVPLPSLQVLRLFYSRRYQMHDCYHCWSQLFLWQPFQALKPSFWCEYLAL